VVNGFSFSDHPILQQMSLDHLPLNPVILTDCERP
jgi:hypothetical protein